MQKPAFLDLNQLNMQQIVYLDTKKTEDIHIQAQQATTAKKGTIQPNANKKTRRKTFHHKDLYQLYNNPKTANDKPKGGKRQRKKRHLGKRKTPFHKTTLRRASQTAKERDEERHTEIRQHAAYDSSREETAARHPQYHRQTYIHCRRPGRCDGSERAEILA